MKKKMTSVLDTKKNVWHNNKQIFKKKMLLLTVAALACLVYGVYLLLTKPPKYYTESTSARTLDADECELSVVFLPQSIKKMIIHCKAGCEFDVFADGLSIIDKPMGFGQATLHPHADALVVIQKRNINLEREINPSVVRFY